MSYAPDKLSRLSWMRFNKAYRRRLQEAGFPDEAFRSERDWNYFADHCYFQSAPEMLNLEQWPSDRLEELLPIFRSIGSDGFYVGEGSGVLDWLERRLERKEAEQAGDGDT